MKETRKELFRWADQIPSDLWDDLRGRPPHQAAEAVGAEWDGKSFTVPLIGTGYTIDPVDQRIAKTGQKDQSVSYQAGVVLLTTLAASKGVPPSGRMIVPQELPGGRMFFTGAHALATGRLAGAFDRDEELLIQRAFGLGGEFIDEADVGIKIPGLPYVPLYILLWRGDSAYPARAVIGIDDRTHFHMDLASTFALTNLLVYRLCKNI